MVPSKTYAYAFLCNPDFETALVEEMGRISTGVPADVPAPGLVLVEDASWKLEETDFVFARQVLPNAVAIEGPSIARLVDAAYPHLRSQLDEATWSLDVVPLDATAFGATRRADLVAEVLLKTLKERRKRVFKGYTDDRTDPAAKRVQVLLTSRDTALVSVANPIAMPGVPWPSPFPGGVVALTEDKDAPSSAYRKLLEAQAWMQQKIGAGDRCVDLGASPGGWSYIALLAGATLTTVDRAALDPRLAKHRRIEHLRRDGFSFVPDRPPVDWLLCDIVAEPQKSIALLTKWTKEGWARRIVLDIKFKGRASYGVLSSLKPLLATHFSHVRIKQLASDGNEVTVMAWGSAHGKSGSWASSSRG